MFGRFDVLTFPEVILAVASPLGRSARGIVRLSGQRTFDLLQPHLILQNTSREAGPDERSEEGPGIAPGRDEETERRGDEEGRRPGDEATVRRSDEGESPPCRRGAYRAILTGLLPADLPALALLFIAPQSYTGEHSAELQLAGNPLLLERIIDGLLDSARRRNIDARRAEAGEFTARAFMNGRMTLTEAEGVAATIAAQSDAELRAARLLTAGRLGELARALADRLAAALALVEAGIDFIDQEDVIAITAADLHAHLAALRDEIRRQLEHSVGLEQLEAIPWVVLTGAPNTGKSTLFNALLGHERAVVSDVAGTTRDVLAEPLTIDTDHGPAEVMLIDLAGFDLGDTALNEQMQALARGAIERAELVIRCVPADAPRAVVDAGALLARTKADLAPERLTAGAGEILVSALTGLGLEALRCAVADRLADRAVSLAADAIALRPRHEAALRSARRNLEEALALIELHEDERALREPELIASIMRSALDELASLAGDITPDDVLGRIFATFCVGK
jgi:tRNA modification GTPase